MSDRDFAAAFNECVDMLGAGRTVEECLRRYPQYAADLRPMLETGLLVRRVMVDPFTVRQAQDRVRFRVAQAMRAPVRKNRTSRSLLSWVAGFILVFLLSTGLLVGSSGSLPGDALYPIKRAAESVQLGLSSDTTLRDQFAQRRIDETAALLAARREAEVRFEGTIEQIDGTLWRIASLPARVSNLTGAAFSIGDRVEVRGLTTSSGELIAAELIMLDDQPPPTSIPPTATPEPPSATPTQFVTNTPSLTATSTATWTASPTATHTSTNTVTWTASPTATHTPTASSTPTRVPPTAAAPLPTLMPTNPPIIQPTQPPAPTDDSGDDRDNSGPGSENSGRDDSDDDSGSDDRGGDDDDG